MTISLRSCDDDLLRIVSNYGINGISGVLWLRGSSNVAVNEAKLLPFLVGTLFGDFYLCNVRGVWVRHQHPWNQT